MKIRKPQREWCEAYAPEIEIIIEAVRVARNAPVGWRPLVTDRADLGDLFGDKPDFAELLRHVENLLGVSIDGSIIDVAKRVRKNAD